MRHRHRRSHPSATLPSLRNSHILYAPLRARDPSVSCTPLSPSRWRRVDRGGQSWTEVDSGQGGQVEVGGGYAQIRTIHFARNLPPPSSRAHALTPVHIFAGHDRPASQGLKFAQLPKPAQACMWSSDSQPLSSPSYRQVTIDSPQTWSRRSTVWKST